MDPAPPLFLIGFMATGKSTVGRLVAARAGRRFVDLDEVVQRMAGKPVPEIFRTEGEAAFRALEALALGEVCGERDVVVACGGGTPCFGDNLQRMRAAGVVVALRASMEEILRRAGVDVGAVGRPLLQGQSPEAARATADALYAQREAVYAAADATVDSAGRDVSAVAEEVLRRAQLRMGTLAVRLAERSYPIHLAPLATAGPLAREMFGDAVALVGLVTDENVARAGHAAAVRTALAAQGFAVVEVVIPPGEAAKTLVQAGDVAARLVTAGLDRRSAVVAVGGGVVGDLAGFVAAMLYRGVACGQVPTTLLAMVDSAIGGKTGVDLPAGKNLLGAFWQPRFVLADVAVLGTLPRRELVAARGEVLKYALLGDPGLFDILETRDVETMDPARQGGAPPGTPPDPARQGGAPPGTPPDQADFVTDVVRRCAGAKAQVVALDERELTGARAALNLGHTVGHAIEAASLAQAAAAGHAGAALLHGEAVALGLVAAARVSARLGACDASLEARIAAVAGRLGLPTDLTPWLTEATMSYLSVDKKRAGGKVRFVVLDAIGRTRLVPLSPAEIAAFLR